MVDVELSAADLELIVAVAQADNVESMIADGDLVADVLTLAVVDILDPEMDPDAGVTYVQPL